MPFALFEAQAPMPGSVLFHEGPLLRAVGMVPHHLVGHGLDFLETKRGRIDPSTITQPMPITMGETAIATTSHFKPIQNHSKRPPQ